MRSIQQYEKYYFLEKYLFETVNRSFHERGYLTPEEFFAIVIWKSNRPKTKILTYLEREEKTIRSITSALFAAQSPQEQLSILQAISGIGIPMASAILTVCFPDKFTVVDYRARASLSTMDVEISGNPAESPRAYLEYVESCKKEANCRGISLRDFDRQLWGMDFYEGENGLKKLVEGLA